jgi:arsenate reductase
MDVTIFHNPACSTSRKVLDRLRSFHIEPTVVDYVKAGWTRPQLQGLLKDMALTPRDILRTKGELAASLGLTDPAATDDAILDAMVAHPVLVERPIVAGPGGTAVCRPVEAVDELLVSP